MSADASRRPATPRATDRVGDPSPFALGLALRRAHGHAAGVMSEALRPLGIELRHFAVLLVAGYAALARPVGGTAAQLLATAALQGRLLLEGDLELVDALTHSHRGRSGDRGADRSKGAQALAGLEL